MLLGGALALLAAATLGAGAFEDRYDVVAPGIVPGTYPADGARGWGIRGWHRIAGDPAALTLIARSAARPTYAIARVPIDRARYDHIHVRAEIRTRDVQAGRFAWQRAQLRVLGVDARGRPLRHWPLEIASASGTTDWQRIDAAVPVSPEARALSFIALVAANRGELDVRSVEISGAVVKPALAAFERALGALWLLAAGLATVSIARSARGAPSRWLVLAGGLVVAIAGTAPEPHYHSIIDATRGAAAHALERFASRSAPVAVESEGAAQAPSASGEDSPRARSGARGVKPPEAPAEALSEAPAQAGSSEPTPALQLPPLAAHADHGPHLAAFTVLAFLAALAYRSRPGRRAIALLALSGSIQVVQTLSVGRGPSLGDVAADALGIGLGTALAAAACALARISHRSAG